MLAGIGLEVNVSTPIIVTVCAHIVTHFVTQLISEISDASSSIDDLVPTTVTPSSQPLTTAIPATVLLTGGLVRLVVWSNTPGIFQQFSSTKCMKGDSPITRTSLFVVDAIHPHLVWHSRLPLANINEGFEIGLSDLQVSGHLLI